MDVVDLKKLVERVLDHSGLQYAIIRRERTFVMPFNFIRLEHDFKSILAAIYGYKSKQVYLEVGAS